MTHTTEERCAGSLRLAAEEMQNSKVDGLILVFSREGDGVFEVITFGYKDIVDALARHFIRVRQQGELGPR